MENGLHPQMLCSKTSKLSTYVYPYQSLGIPPHPQEVVVASHDAHYRPSGYYPCLCSDITHCSVYLYDHLNLSRRSIENSEIPNNLDNECKACYPFSIWTK